ncbi:MAG: MFS transporter [Kineosporiaceae bacterium]
MRSALSSRPRPAPAPRAEGARSPAGRRDRTALVKARIAATGLFVTLGLLVGGWLSRIPDVKRVIGLGDARWGVVSTSGSLGSLTAMLITAALITRFGVRRMTLVGVPVMLLAMPVLAGSTSVPHLVIGLVCWGLASGTIQAPINSVGIAVERAYGRPIMSGVHAGFSLGTLAGALLGAIAVRLGLTPGAQLVVTSVLLGAAFAVTGRWLPRDEHAAAPAAAEDVEAPPTALESGDPFDDEGAHAAAARRGRPAVEVLADPAPAARRRASRQLAVLAAMAFCSALAEGTSSQWAGIYTRQVLGASASTAALVYASFAAAMSIGRIVGDRFVHLLGRRRFLSTVPLLCAVGLGTGLAVGTVPSAVVGFACAGFGLSCVTPTVFGAAGNLPGLPQGRGVSIMTVAAWPAFLTGPSLVGAIAGAAGLRVALVVVVAAAAVAAGLATFLRLDGERE